MSRFSDNDIIHVVFVDFVFSEPAILVMNNSQKTHAAVTASLLDFLCRVSGDILINCIVT